MKPVKQTIIDFKNGNCIQACVASIFEIELDKVPNFMMNGTGDFNKILSDFCKRYGFSCVDVEVRDNEKGVKFLKGLYSIGIGLSPRGNLKDQHHGVVCYEGKIIYNPIDEINTCPCNSFHNDEILLHMIFVIKNPSKFKELEV